jgi:hypothetical protein
MKALVVILLIAGAVQAAPILAQSSAASPLLGSWAVDVTRLPMSPAARPKSVTFTFSDAGNGKWTTHVDILGGDGTATHSVSIAALDGTPASIENSPEADTVALKLPSPNVLVMDLVKGGIPASTRVYTVAADGTTLTETTAYAGGNGMPMMRTNYFTRVR